MINFHPALKSLLKFKEDFPLCPNCQTRMEYLSAHNKNYLVCEECTKEVFICYEHFSQCYDTLHHTLIINKRKVGIYFYYSSNQTKINYGDGEQLIIPHINFPFFNELKMRHKLKFYLTFT